MPSITRRDVLKRMGVGTAIIWAAPVVSSLATPASAASPPGNSATRVQTPGSANSAPRPVAVRQRTSSAPAPRRQRATACAPTRCGQETPSPVYTQQTARGYTPAGGASRSTVVLARDRPSACRRAGSTSTRGWPTPPRQTPGPPSGPSPTEPLRARQHHGQKKYDDAP